MSEEYPYDRALHIMPDNRVLIVAATGAGKTYLVTKLLIGRRRLLVVDPKHEFSWGANGAYDHIVYSAKDVMKWDRDYPLIYRPSIEEIGRMCEDVFGWVWQKAGSIRVYIDELSEFTPRLEPKPNLRRLIKMGRSKHKSVWYSTQRPAMIPISFISEAEVTFCGLLRNPNDRKRIADYTGFTEVYDKVPQYSFWYCNSIDNKAFIFNANELRRKKKK